MADYIESWLCRETHQTYDQLVDAYLRKAINPCEFGKHKEHDKFFECCGHEGCGFDCGCLCS